MAAEHRVPAPRLESQLADHLHGFLRDLRTSGLCVSTPKQLDFLHGIEIGRPNAIDVLYWIAVTTLTSSLRDRDVLDPVFARWFTDESIPPSPAPEDGPADDGEVPGPVGRDATATAENVDPRGTDDGLEPSAADLEHRRRFDVAPRAALDEMARIRQLAPTVIPAVRSYRRKPSRRGHWLDLRRVCTLARRTQGEIIVLRRRSRPRRQRRVLLLIDVSGSMKQYSTAYLRLAHALIAGCERAEAFTFGTRLTRVTPALRTRDVDAALGSLTDLVRDVDGGTRIGAVIDEFLDNPRYVATARDAVVIVLSDGLERGECQQMHRTVRRLSLLSHRLVWWSPLAVDPAYRPRTRGMAGILADLDALAGVDDLTSARTQLERLRATCTSERHHIGERRDRIPETTRSAS
ncbi:vWA domain-containing protein [Solicola gregarius]|uniref:VWA domain-containing protein n=1 Tax=Solicola gregarius TaxID=2908642 RepID=A0AA46TJT8_9ACTN|nr:VWA domain-containing protein [Solicola gregarius]UYM06580.1 VWA domain-containing protein [Solicola gregarius]